MKKINQYKRTYYKEQGVIIGLVMAFVIAVLPNLDDMGKEVYVREPEVAVVVKATVPVTKENTKQVGKKEIEEKIREYFPRSHKTMLAIAKAESNLNMNAKGWNCYYNKDETIVYTTRVKGSHSTSCKVQHRKYSHSIDCFALQRNYPNRKECPKVTVDQHLKEVANLSRVQGLGAWSAYNNGSYKKHLASN